MWGDGTAMRVFTYVDDLVDGIYRLMRSDITEPTNIGSDERVSVNDLVALVADVAGKTVKISHVDGPVGVHARNHSSARIRELGWTDEHSLRDGIAKTYPWVKEQTELVRNLVRTKVDITGVHILSKGGGGFQTQTAPRKLVRFSEAVALYQEMVNHAKEATEYANKLLDAIADPERLQFRFATQRSQRRLDIQKGHSRQQR